MNTEQPTPPPGMRILSDDELTKPLPMDAMCIMKDDPEDVWEPSGYIGELPDNASIALLYYATAEGVPDWRKLVEELQTELATERQKRERAEADAAALSASLAKRAPRIGSWDNECALCHATTEDGDIPHEADCPFVLSSTAGAELLAERDSLRAEVERLREDHRAIRNRLVSAMTELEPGEYEVRRAHAEAKVNEFEEAFNQSRKEQHEA